MTLRLNEPARAWWAPGPVGNRRALGKASVRAADTTYGAACTTDELAVPACQVKGLASAGPAVRVMLKKSDEGATAFVSWWAGTASATSADRAGWWKVEIVLPRNAVT